MISDADFNPLHAKAKGALKRLRDFHAQVARHSARNFPTLVMNDGAVAYRDLSFRSRAPTDDFVKRAWDMYEAISSQDKLAGYPGVRFVLASGFRMLGRRAGLDASRGQLESILERFKAGMLTVDQALYEAAAMRPRFDIVPQLQANFAFAKAYVADQSGAKGGLPGPSFYVDLALYKSDVPQSLRVGAPIEWSDKRLKLTVAFAEVRGVVKGPQLNGGGVDTRDAVEIAEHLSGDPNVLALLRAARK